MDTAIKHNIRDYLNRIEQDNYDEDSMKLLLIEIRSFLAKGSLIREFSDFVAHPETRDRGVTHEYLSKIGIRCKYGFAKKPFPVQEICPQTFEAIRGMISEFPQALWGERISISQNKAKKHLKQWYRRNKGIYRIKNSITQDEFEELHQILNVATSQMEVKPAISPNTIVDELGSCVSQVFPDWDIDILQSNCSGLTLCLLSIIQKVPLRLTLNMRAFLAWNNSNINELTLWAFCEGPEYVDFCFCFATTGIDPTTVIDFGSLPKSSPNKQCLFKANRDDHGCLRLSHMGDRTPFPA